jgi:hypothetical protein
MKNLIRNHQQMIKRATRVSMGLFCVLVLLAFSSNGQQIQELGSKLANMKASPDPSVRAEGVHLESLVYNIQPTLYYENGQLVNVPGEPPVRVNTDVQSLGAVTKASYGQVEIIVIKIQSLQELQMQLNVASLSGFSKLGYIYFLCSFELCSGQAGENSCELEKIARMINLGNNTTVNVTYSVSIPS